MTQHFDKNLKAFEKALTDLINCHSIDNETNIPDYILAEYLCSCVRGIAGFQLLMDERNDRDIAFEKPQPKESGTLSVQLKSMGRAQFKTFDF